MSKGKYHEWRTEDGLILIAGWVRSGLRYDQIAKNMGISECTLYDWQNRFPEIANALKKTREIVDFEVENALYENAMAGNVTAQIFWLKNRLRKRWMDKPVDDGGGATIKVVFDVDEEEQPNGSDRDTPSTTEP